jgi:Ca2+-binding RTX toxin-like protein
MRLSAALLMLGLLVPAAAQAKTACHYDSGTKVLSITATRFDEVEIQRSGSKILASAISGSLLDCGDHQPTVTDTDRVEITLHSEGSAWIYLAGGAFAPGATPELEGSSEIEFALSGSGYANFEGGSGRDHFRYMDSGDESGVNLNAEEDDDLDLSVSSNPSQLLLFVLKGGPGADLIEARGVPRLEMLARGGAGNDMLIAPRSGGAILEGESGRDQIFGGHEIDLIVPGSGADLVKSYAGPDLLLTGPDRSRDRIFCGSGRDKVGGKGDRRDRLHSCERS